MEGFRGDESEWRFMGCAKVRQPGAGLIRDRGKPPGVRTIGVVSGPERIAEESPFSVDAREHDDKHQHGDGDADNRAERQCPAERVDEKSQIISDGE